MSDSEPKKIELTSDVERENFLMSLDLRMYTAHDLKNNETLKKSITAMLLEFVEGKQPIPMYDNSGGDFILTAFEGNEENSEFVGGLHIHVDEGKSLEASITIFTRQRFQGKGIATYLLETMIKRVRQNTNLRKLKAQTLPDDNPKSSARVFIRVGFKLSEVIKREAGLDRHIYELDLINYNTQ